MSKRRKQAHGRTSRFAHPSEAAFARILDFYGLEWQYEPRTFAIAWDDDGRVVEAFSPDFYLPESDLYVELTTQKQALITYKNRKIRLLRELYPEIRVKLLTRNDFGQLLTKYGLEDAAPDIIGQQALDRLAQAGEAEPGHTVS